jgi:hypothetical protein
MQKKWICGWGYQALDHCAFPLYFENVTQYFYFRSTIDGSAIRIHLNNQYQLEEQHIDHLSAVCSEFPGARFDRCNDTDAEEMSISGNSSKYSASFPMKIKKGNWICISFHVRKAVIASASSFMNNEMSGVRYVLDQDKKSAVQSEFFVKEPALNAVALIDEVQIETDANILEIAAFGDSITHMSLWTAPLARRLLLEKNNAVLMNCGICGNRLLHNASHGSGQGNWFGRNGFERFEKDIWGKEKNVKVVLFLEGINDILHPAIGEAPSSEEVTPSEIVEKIEQCAEIAHRHNTLFYAGTVMPFRGCKDHWTPYLENERMQTNNLIRSSQRFDGILDYDEWCRDQLDPTYLNPAGNSADRLHPGVEGGRLMAEMIPLDQIINNLK